MSWKKEAAIHQKILFDIRLWLSLAMDRRPYDLLRPDDVLLQTHRIEERVRQQYEEV